MLGMLKVAETSIGKRIRAYSGWAAIALVSIGTILGFATFLLLTGLTPIKPSATNIGYMLAANVAVVVVMVAMIVGQVAHLFWERRQGTAGAGLHIRLVTLLSLVSVVPALLVAAFASVTLNRGLDTWFSTQTKAIVDTAATVADAYLTNASEATRNDLANIATDLVQQVPEFNDDRPNYLRRVARHGALRNLAAVYIFNIETKQIEANATANDSITFIAPPPETLTQADKGDIVMMPPGRGGNLIRALMKLQGYPNEYLYIYRVVSPAVIDQLTKTRDAKAQYDLMLEQRLGFQLTFGLIYALLALIFLLAAVWAGMWFSDRLVAPVVRLLNASRDVMRGDFSARVKIIEGPGDLQRLSQTFNLMTEQIAQSRDQLMRTNEKLDERRRFTEAMLEGVSAGVIGIGPNHVITLVNRSALTHLGVTDVDLMGRPIENAVPEFAELYHAALSRPQGSAGRPEGEGA
jgi:two-component system nitrogen regulation sensor histidine kinase NtrY